MKRFRKPILKDGELRVYWGKLKHENPDIIFAYQGDGYMKRDTRLLHNFINTQSPNLFEIPLFSKMKPSLIEELEARGYDITTLKFSIRKKKANENNC